MIKTLSQQDVTPKTWLEYIEKIDSFDWNGAHFLARKMDKGFAENERLTLAFDNQNIVGMGALTNTDIADIPETPFFSTLYVLPDYRKNKIAHKIVLQTLEEARNMGYKHIYTQTDLNGFYEQLGFSFKRQIVDFMGRDIRLYEQSLF
uniref:Putative GCN5-like N-acetyltransferase n=1 Tax=Weissella thailandensis fsh4-2 TaxID=1056112 RepID=G0UEV9_9LACO|nr:putative GCN5-like N-acetyltransferase [Weissella thailandensis fsh4-2]